MTRSARILVGDVLKRLDELPDRSVHCCVTSPPYWGLRDYGEAGQIGLEAAPEEYVAKLVEVFAAVRRVLRDDGTVWVNLGDCYAGTGKSGGGDQGKRWETAGNASHVGSRGGRWSSPPANLKAGDLVGIPWMVARALQAPQYTGTIAKEVDRVWLAAIIDGEGTICGTRHKRKDDGRIRTQAAVFVTNSCRLMLDRCGEIWPAPEYAHMRNSAGHLGDRDMFRWTVQGATEKSNLLAELYPYFVSKRKQALLAWNLAEFMRDGRRLGKSSQAESVREKREVLVRGISLLNHAEPFDVPGWCKEPPSLYRPGWYLRRDVIWSKPNPMPESVNGWRWEKCRVKVEQHRTNAGLHRDDADVSPVTSVPWASWADCPGCPSCAPNDGLVLRRGSWRCTTAHEYIFQLAKSQDYFCDAQAVREPARYGYSPTTVRSGSGWSHNQKESKTVTPGDGTGGRNPRSVWTITTKPFSEAHFATFPPELPERCIRAGTAEKNCGDCGAPWAPVVEQEAVPEADEYTGKHRISDEQASGRRMLRSVAYGRAAGLPHDNPIAPSFVKGHRPTCTCNADPVAATVLDPFSGAGTTGLVALRLNRDYIGIELKSEYANMAEKRIREDAPLFNSVEMVSVSDSATLRAGGPEPERPAAP